MSGCHWCGKPRQRIVYHGRWTNHCFACHSDHRTPMEKRRDEMMQAHGDKPDGYTPEVLRQIANGPIFDSSDAYCPAGKLSMEETKRREQSNILK